MYGTTGRIMTGYAVDHVMPSMMESGDLELACSSGVAFAVFMSSFRRVTDEPARASLVTYASAGFCAELLAREAELAQLRAVHEGAAGSARDARILEKRHHATAARRFLSAYRSLEKAFGKTGAECPELEREEEPIYLLGLAGGVNAVLHDRAAGARADVPLAIPQSVARATRCLDDARWFGVPRAIRAAVWAAIPGGAPEGVDVWKTLAEASALGEAAGVRLAGALEVQALGAAGKDDAHRAAITAHALSLEKRSPNAQWRLLDAVGAAMVLHESDKLWVRAAGHRTPEGKLGSFLSVDEPVDVDDSLLDDLSGEPNDSPLGDPSDPNAPTTPEDSP